MSLYRQAGGLRPRAVALVALGTLAAGLVTGYAVGRGTAEEPSLSEQLAHLNDDLRPALNALELVRIEYAEAVRGGTIAAETEYEAAQAHLETAASVLAANEEDSRALSASSYEAAVARVEEVRDRVEEVVEPAVVDAAADRAADAIAMAGGGIESLTRTVRSAPGVK